MGSRGRATAGVAVLLALAVAAPGCGSGADQRPRPSTPSTSPATPATTTTTTIPATTRATTTTPATTTPAPTAPAPTAPAPTAPATTTTTARPSSAAGSASEQLAGLTVRSSDPVDPYRRDEFGEDWDYDPASGCNTRERVLIDESVIAPTVDDRCRTTVGLWRSLYDGVETADPADLQIDHLVPLADAWRSGADTWTPERRRAFANDRTSAATLIAVTGHTNQSKGDSTPDVWLPPDERSWCTYAQMWVGVKATWGLSVTASERGRLQELLGAC